MVYSWLKKSRNVNVPWPTKGMGDADYMLAFQQIVMPIAHEFDPDLIISKHVPHPFRLTITKIWKSLLALTPQKETNSVVVL